MLETWPGKGEDAWVFAYGSLMWDPCFPYNEARRALLRGYHRALCILSILNRGTVDRPGLALGLDRGGSCRGFAFRIDAPHLAAAKADLWRREMSHAVYQPKILTQPEQAATLVAQGAGAYGAALDYLRNVVRHLDDFGIDDCPLHRVLALAEAKAAGARGEADA